jgi:putative endonuclease
MILVMPFAGKFERLLIDAQEWGLAHLERLPVWARRTSPVVPHLAVGLRGERAALFELRRRGVVVVARRWTSARMLGDVDQIGWDGDRLCFIEVKTRTARDMNPAEAEVDEHKRRMVRALARQYLHSFPEAERSSVRVRFDVVAVYLMGGVAEFEIFEGAYGWN